MLERRSSNLDFLFLFGAGFAAGAFAFGAAAFLVAAFGAAVFFAFGFGVSDDFV